MDALQEKRLFKLRLPKGGFWNKPNPAEDARWVEKDKVWRSMRQLDLEKSGAEPFWLLDGPPYANGELHMGHLLNKFLKDALARHALMSGRSVVWRSGWDCHGLPLELAAEKENPKGPRSGVEFVASCRRLAFLWMGRQGDAFKRLGLSADLEKPWATMDKEKEAKGLALLRALREAGLLVERHAPAHWCPACGSALAASELERETKPRRELWAGALFSEDSQAKLCAHRPELAGKELALAFWTTTPWSLGGNKAFAFAKEARFGFWERADGFVFCAAQAADEKMKERGLKKLDVEVASDELAAMGLEAQLPFFDEARPVAPALFASALEGTGFVHVAPAFGPEDFEWGETMGLDAKSPVGKRGAYEEGAGAGLKRKEAGALFEEKLSSANLLLAAEEKEAEGFVCWRHNAPVFWRSSRQWALDLEKPFAGCPEGLAGRALALLDQTEFQPSQKAKQSLRSMLRGRRFWTLSRDRAWGLPLPFLRDASGNLHPDEAHCWEKAQELLASGGVEAWQAWEAPAGWEKENQCVDVWFDSGVCRQTADEGLNRSPDLVCEGQDQSRGWFLSSMLLGAFFSAAPVFKTVFTHGFVVGEDGEKTLEISRQRARHRKVAR